MTRAVQSAAIVGRSLDLPIQVKFDLHEWIPDFTYEWSDYETILAAADDLAKCGGEWPPGESRNWEPLSSVFDRTTGVLKGYLSFKNVLVVCHEYVIYSITGAKPGLGELSKHTMENS